MNEGKNFLNGKYKHLLHSIQNSFRKFKKFGFESDPYVPSFIRGVVYSIKVWDTIYLPLRLDPVSMQMTIQDRAIGLLPRSSSQL
jgi:hypothetical protein